MLLACIWPSGSLSFAQSTIHLRNAGPPEWSEFSEKADSAELRHSFAVVDPTADLTLQINQSNVKQLWELRVNDKAIGTLHRDENPITALFAVPSAVLQVGENELVIRCRSKSPDDILLSEIQLVEGKPAERLHESAVKVRVTEKDGGLVPCRLTIIGGDHLMTVGAESDDNKAVRPGVIYCRGTAEFGLPSGKWTIVAGRGPEYSIHRLAFSTERGKTALLELQLERQVNTAGLVACDTHVHTLTHSGHGDSTVRERLLTLAGECVELPIATDHNKHIDYTSVVKEMKLGGWFTPVIGNEVTTRIGHFNIFPVSSADTPVPDHEPRDWSKIFDNIFATKGTRVAILNHARDVHSGYRPFGPRHHLAVTGRNIDGWVLRANAMEVINSGAQQTDMMQLVTDWMAMQNSGRFLTPVGCSDSHDVARHFVAQARTYIRCDDSDPGNIDVDSAVTAFLEGKVLVSCGLIADVRLNETAGPGELLTSTAESTAVVDVSGPDWIEADRVAIYVNGQLLTERALDQTARKRGGLKQRFTFQLPKARHDYLVSVVATGPGMRGLWWPIARPYQPDSAVWNPQMMGLSGAVRVDADGDGRFQCAAEYAKRIWRSADGNPLSAIHMASDFDAAVQLQLADLLYQQNRDAFFGEVLSIARRTPVKEAFDAFADSARASERAVVLPE